MDTLHRVRKSCRYVGRRISVLVIAGFGLNCAESGSTPESDAKSMDPSLPSGDNDDKSSASDSEESDAVVLDPKRLDRGAACLLDDDDCGYPKNGEEGTLLGQRAPNFAVQDCAGDSVEFAELFQADIDDTYRTRAVLFAIAAGWCGPCKTEAPLLVAAQERFQDQGLSSLHLLYQGNDQSPPTKAFCSEWQSQFDIDDRIWMDQLDKISSRWLFDVERGLPIAAIIDANANIREIFEGELPDDLDKVIQSVLDAPYKFAE